MAGKNMKSVIIYKVASFVTRRLVGARTPVHDPFEQYRWHHVVYVLNDLDLRRDLCDR